MNGKSPMISPAPPFVPSIDSGQALRLSKDERRVFQQNLHLDYLENIRGLGSCCGRMKCFLDLKGEGLRLDEKQMREEVPRDRGRGLRARLEAPALPI